MPPSNSCVITDSNLLTNDIIDDKRNKYFKGLENLKDILYCILPEKFKSIYYVLIICPPKQNLPYKDLSKIIKQWITDIKNARPYVEIEFITTSKTLHSRNLYSNYYTLNLDKGFYVFEPWSTTVHRDGDSFNKLNIKSYLSEPFKRGDSELSTANDDLERLKVKYEEMLEYRGNNVDDTLKLSRTTIYEPINEDAFNKNRILF